VARAAFGDEVVEHYATRPRWRSTPSTAAVTDWELIRGFERL
jgi:glutamine synthetase